MEEFVFGIGREATAIRSVGAFGDKAGMPETSVVCDVWIQVAAIGAKMFAPHRV